MTKPKCFKYRVNPEHVDFQKNILPTILADMIVKAAGEDADQHGLGLMDLHKKNCSWVISRFVIDMDIIPTINDVLNIATWVKDVGNVFTTRNFRISNGEERVMGYAALSWAILDLDTRKSIPLNNLPELNNFIVDEEIPIESPIRIPDIEGEVANGFEVKYSDIDLNVHTNALKYLQCFCDCFSLEFYEKRILKRVDINFVKELKYGEKGLVYREEVADNDFLFKLQTSEGSAVSRGRMLFEKK
ncbi:MAG: thioesterase [Dysgonamonadaceae bacterium]|nr:thioesterase [Dysgonamonadaceae bacterium]MDD4729219.1 thioesterase [Dysgonamonadaceae bacterium]